MLPLPFWNENNKTNNIEKLEPFIFMEGMGWKIQQAEGKNQSIRQVIYLKNVYEFERPSISTVHQFIEPVPPVLSL